LKLPLRQWERLDGCDLQIQKFPESNLMQNPCLVVSDCNGNIFEIPDVGMAAFSGVKNVVPDETDLIPLPEGSMFFTLPGRAATGYDNSSKKFITITEYGNKRVFPVAAFMPPGYVRTLHSAYTELKGAPSLPLYCYTATGWENDRFYVAGNRIDRRIRHKIADTDFSHIDMQAAALLRRHKGNRLVEHLVNNCVFKYRCPNACNLALVRWECPVPVSKACNAACIGCISSQNKSSGFPSSQHRLDFIPGVEEILDYVVPHIKNAPDPIISFGQGCEGEPLLQAELIEEAIRKIRMSSRRGILNINTNAGIPDALEALCKAGLDSMRVSLNSAQDNFYQAYYRPRNYSFADVRKSISIAKRYNVWVSLNYLVFPGFTDNPSEIAAFLKLAKDAKIDMIQMRNLNIDPQLLCRKMSFDKLSGNPVGIVNWIKIIKKEVPHVIMGYFNPTITTMKASRVFLSV
jgi:pyruvate-formate lyase-activating enzyme